MIGAVYQLPEPVQPTSAEWLARDEAALAGVLPRITDVVAVRGEGSWLWDADGRRYLDFGSGIAVTNTGHCHPKVVAAITAQAETLIHTSVVAHPTGMIRLAERLAGLVPFMTEPQVFFCNSGAEAVDGSLKLARKVTGKPGVIAFRRAFHGRTLAATSLTTAKGKYREGYEPLLPSVTIAPYGDLDGLDELLDLQAPGANLGAMIVEPVLGEGGYVVPPRSWLAGLRERCDRHGMLLIFDEVQTGVGRTGRPFAAETFGVAPDVLLFAKGIASGLPLGGIIAPRGPSWTAGRPAPTARPSAGTRCRVPRRWPPSTCWRRRAATSGPAASAAVALERLGAVPGPVDVRGVGLMIGVELRDKAVAEAVQARCLDDGLIVLLCGPGENVLRLIPPLTITDADFERGLDILVAAIAATA